MGTYKSKYLCKMTDLYTYLDNLSADEGFQSSQAYIVKNYEGSWNFCAKIINTYFASNIQNNLNELMG